MLMLAVDTSCHVASAALLRDGVCVLERFADPAQKHAVTLLPLVESVLGEAETAIGDVDLFAVDIGPGSFTGVRIGVSAVNAMAFACGKSVVPVDALRALYEPFADTGTHVCALIDAGNGNAYAAQYRANETLAAPDAIVIRDYLVTLPKDARIIGDVEEAGEKAYPSAKYVALAAARMADMAVTDAKPMYLRPSQAERLWRQRQEAKQGGR